MFTQATNNKNFALAPPPGSGKTRGLREYLYAYPNLCILCFLESHDMINKELMPKSTDPAGSIPIHRYQGRGHLCALKNSDPNLINSINALEAKGIDGGIFCRRCKWFDEPARCAYRKQRMLWEDPDEKWSWASAHKTLVTPVPEKWIETKPCDMIVIDENCISAMTTNLRMDRPDRAILWHIFNQYKLNTIGRRNQRVDDLAEDVLNHIINRTSICDPADHNQNYPGISSQDVEKYGYSFSRFLGEEYYGNPIGAPYNYLTIFLRAYSAGLLLNHNFITSSYTMMSGNLRWNFVDYSCLVRLSKLNPGITIGFLDATPHMPDLNRMTNSQVTVVGRNATSWPFQDIEIVCLTGTRFSARQLNDTKYVDTLWDYCIAPWLRYNQLINDGPAAVFVPKKIQEDIATRIQQMQAEQLHKAQSKGESFHPLQINIGHFWADTRGSNRNITATSMILAGGFRRNLGATRTQAAVTGEDPSDRQRIELDAEFYQAMGRYRPQWRHIHPTPNRFRSLIASDYWPPLPFSVLKSMRPQTFRKKVNSFFKRYTGIFARPERPAPTFLSNLVS